jgi:hypothetical protein
VLISAKLILISATALFGIETDKKNLPSGNYLLVVKGFNLEKQQ